MPCLLAFILVMGIVSYNEWGTLAANVPQKAATWCAWKILWVIYWAYSSSSITVTNYWLARSSASLCSSTLRQSIPLLAAETNHVQNYFLQLKEIYAPVEKTALYTKACLLRIFSTHSCSRVVYKDLRNVTLSQCRANKSSCLTLKA